MTKYISILVLATLTLVACQSPKEKALQHIKGLESNDSVFTNELMNDLKMAYVDFVKTYPDDEHAAEFLFKAAQRSIALQEFNEAVEMLKQITEKYPKSTMVEDALFLAAYTYENHLHDLPQAKMLYEDFLSKYPKGELAEDARYSLENLGKSPEELLNAIPEE